MAALRGASYLVLPIWWSLFSLVFLPIQSESPPKVDTSHYHNYTQVESVFKQYVRDHPKLARLYTIGTSVMGRQLYVLRLSRYVYAGFFLCVWGKTQVRQKLRFKLKLSFSIGKLRFLSHFEVICVN